MGERGVCGVPGTIPATVLGTAILTQRVGKVTDGTVATPLTIERAV